MKNYFAIKTDCNYYLLHQGETCLLNTINETVYLIINYFNQYNNLCIDNILNDYRFINIPRKIILDNLAVVERYEKSGIISNNIKECSSRFNANSCVTEHDVKRLMADISEITFEVTQRCNLNCKYCGYGDFYCKYDKRVGADLSFNYAKNIIDYIFRFKKDLYPQKKNGPFNFSFYGGEPLLNIELIREIVNYCEATYPQVEFTYSMTTNGTLLQKYSEFIVNNDIKISVSLDGDQFNNSYRVYKNDRESFQDIINNVKFFQENHPHFYERKINFISVLHNRNSIIEIEKFFLTKFNKIPVVSELSTNGILPSKVKSFKNLFKNVADSYHKYYKCPNAKLSAGILNTTPEIVSFHSLVGMNTGHCINNFSDILVKPNKLPTTGTCLPFQKSIFLTVNGKLMPCESIGNEFVYGNVTNNDVDVNFLQVANDFNDRLLSIKKQCYSCYLLENCQECVYMVINSDKKCRNYMNYEQFKSYVTDLLVEIENINHINNKN